MSKGSIGHKNVLIKNIGAINSIDQVQKALIFITSAGKSGSYERALMCALKELWWECHEMNKKYWSDLEWETRKYKTKSPNHYTKPALSELDIQELISNCRTYRQTLFIKFLSETGLRVSEMTDILISDCRTNGGGVEISIKAKKTGQPIRRKITHKFYNDIIKTFHGSTWIFETSGGKSIQPEYISGEIRKIGILIDKKISAHSMRHFYITNRLNNNDNCIEVSRDVGHLRLGSILDNYYTGK